MQEACFSPVQAEVELRRLGRRESWLWWSAATVMLLSAVAFVLIAGAGLTRQNNALIRADQAAWALLTVLLVFHVDAVYRQWRVRRARKSLLQQIAGGDDLETSLAGAYSGSTVDPLTGLPTRAMAEQSLNKEIATARRRGTPLTLLLLEVNDFAHMNEAYGHEFGDTVLQAFAKQLRKVSRGSDLVVRFSKEDFLMVLPDCTVQGVRNVLGRMKPVEVDWRGRNFLVDYSSAWVDYQPGELPSSLLKRADSVLQLYKKAGEESEAAAIVH